MTGLISLSTESFPYTTSILRLVGTHDPETSRIEIDQNRLSALRTFLSRRDIDDTYSIDECTKMAGVCLKTLQRRGFPQPSFRSPQQDGRTRYPKTDVDEWLVNNRDHLHPEHKSLSKDEVIQIRILLKMGGMTQAEIGTRFGVTSQSIWNIKAGRTHKQAA